MFFLEALGRFLHIPGGIRHAAAMTQKDNGLFFGVEALVFFDGFLLNMKIITPVNS